MNNSSNDIKRGPCGKLQPIDEIFLVLYHLRCSILEKDLGNQLSVDPSKILWMLTTWINFLCFTLKQLPIWASHEIVNQTMPACFKADHPATHIILIA